MDEKEFRLQVKKGPAGTWNIADIRRGTLVTFEGARAEKAARAFASLVENSEYAICALESAIRNGAFDDPDFPFPDAPKHLCEEVRKALDELRK